MMEGNKRNFSVSNNSWIWQFLSHVLENWVFYTETTMTFVNIYISLPPFFKKTEFYNP